MPLPLMPGDEPIEIQYKEPEPQVSSGWAVDASAGIPGCNCPACQREREATQRAAPPPAFRHVSGPMFFGEAPQFIDPVRLRPQAPRPGLIQGVYDFRGGDSMNGSVRWLDPNTGDAYDSDGRIQWTFMRDEYGWVDTVRRSSHRFLPDGDVSVFDRNAPGVFNWR